MQILIAINLLLAFCAGPLLPIPSNISLEVRSLCIVITGVMTILLSQFLPHFVALRHRLDSPWEMDAGKIQLIIWTIYSWLVSLLFQWTHIARTFAPEGWLLSDLLILLPHLCSLLCLWWVADWSRAPQPWRIKQWTGSLLAQKTKIHLFVVPVVLPILVVLIAKQLLENSFQWTTVSIAGQISLLTVISSFALAVVFPLLLSFGMGQRYPACRQLQRLLEQTDFGFHLTPNILVLWDTRLRIANAAVIGCLPGIRKILISDVLERIFYPDEVFAVIAHEAGHIKRSHVLIRVAAATLPLIVMLGAVNLFQRNGFTNSVNLDWQSIWPAWLMVAFGLPLLFAAFGTFAWISRELELEADRYAWKLLQQHRISSRSLASAFEKCARVTGTPHNRVTWMHPSTRQRIRQLQVLDRDANHAKRLDATGKRIRMALVLALLASVPLLVLNL